MAQNGMVEQRKRRKKNRKNKLDVSVQPSKKLLNDNDDKCINVLYVLNMFTA